MTDEEMRKTMQFILETQASSAAKIEALTNAQNRAEERWTRTEESIRALLAVAEIHEQEITAQGERLIRLAEEQARLAKTHSEAQDRTDKQMAETDERLNALINTVERYLSKGQNGA